jgi:16S rRNA (adenine1518-N6/adenine1519-N6)-dimethyltransferase
MVPLGAQRARRATRRPRAHRGRAFSQRRKTLRNAVRAFVPADAFERTGIDPGRRGETLSVREFIALADASP